MHTLLQSPFPYEFDSQICKGLEIIQLAVDEHKKSVSTDIAHWKELESARQSQIQSLSLEVKNLHETLSRLENQIELLENENKSLKNSQATLQNKYSNLKRASLQLEKFRKSIVQMVELSPQASFDDPSLVLEHPSLKGFRLSPTPVRSSERISPSPIVTLKHDRNVIETSSTHALKKSVSPLPSGGLRKSSFPTQEEAELNDLSYSLITEKSAFSRISSRKPSTTKDAQSLYRKIRGALNAEAFTNFAEVIHSFNNHKLNVDETISKIDELVQDRGLFSEMKQLIYRALEENSFSKNTN